MKQLTLLITALALAWPVLATTPSKHIETRYCGLPERNADGSIRRDASVTREFQKQNPCPSTGLTIGSCPGWFKDHVKPLACGGCDSVSNMQWLDTTAKKRKDMFERWVTPPVAGISPQACELRLQPGATL